MCGLCGFINKAKKEEKEKIITEMASKIIHRGPDSEGIYADNNIAVAFRRLSIIDLAGGSQPIFNEDNTKFIFFNGEIYNYQELKKDLEKKYKFKTKTDTEVILHGYEEYGEKIVDKLRGMFAFVIWDTKKKEMFGARDQFGIKPFYYYLTDDMFMWGSEIKTFTANPYFKKELNDEALRPYLTFQFSSMEETFFKGVKKLKPGHYFKYKNGKMDIKEYWDVEFNEDRTKTMEEFIPEINKVMEDSVKHHKISDVKVGSFLSGGVDSSYIAAQLRPDNTFSVGFERAHFSEIDQAKELSELLETKNINKIVTPDEFFNILPEIMYHSDEPHANLSAVPLYFLSEITRPHVTVVLSGEGADEVFGGNDTYGISDRDRKYRKLPKALRHAIGKFAFNRPWFHGRRFLVKNGLSPEEYYAGNAFIFNENEKDKVLQPKYLKGKMWYEITNPIYEKVKDKDDVTKMKYLDIHLWLPEDLLLKADKMTMAHSIELRVPFLDKEVMKLAQTIPVDYEIQKNTTKYIFRKAANEILPDEWATRPKWGFPVPFHYWIREEKYYNIVKEAFSEKWVNKFFKQDYLLKLLEDHYNSKKQNGRKIYVIYTFILWYKEYFINER